MQAVYVNDVDVYWFYIGKCTQTLWWFDLLDLEEVDDPDLDWDTY
jgi:hypothetical protein